MVFNATFNNIHSDPDKNPKGEKQCNDQVQTNVICKSKRKKY
jgi:hypothetical protein